jgi:hypothetical protein
MTEAGGSARIATEIIPSGVVSHQHDDVWPLVRRLCRADPELNCGRSRQACHEGQTVTEYFWFTFNCHHVGVLCLGWFGQKLFIWFTSETSPPYPGEMHR